MIFIGIMFSIPLVLQIFMFRSFRQGLQMSRQKRIPNTIAPEILPSYTGVSFQRVFMRDLYRVNYKSCIGAITYFSSLSISSMKTLSFWTFSSLVRFAIALRSILSSSSRLIMVVFMPFCRIPECTDLHQVQLKYVLLISQSIFSKAGPAVQLFKRLQISQRLYFPIFQLQSSLNLATSIFCISLSVPYIFQISFEARTATELELLVGERAESMMDSVCRDLSWASPILRTLMIFILLSALWLVVSIYLIRIQSMMKQLAKKSRAAPYWMTVRVCPEFWPFMRIVERSLEIADFRNIELLLGFISGLGLAAPELGSLSDKGFSRSGRGLGDGNLLIWASLIYLDKQSMHLDMRKLTSAIGMSPKIERTRLLILFTEKTYGMTIAIDAHMTTKAVARIMGNSKEHSSQRQQQNLQISSPDFFQASMRLNRPLYMIEENNLQEQLSEPGARYGSKPKQVADWLLSKEIRLVIKLQVLVSRSLIAFPPSGQSLSSVMGMKGFPPARCMLYFDWSRWNCSVFSLLLSTVKLLYVLVRSLGASHVVRRFNFLMQQVRSAILSIFRQLRDSSLNPQTMNPFRAIEALSVSRARIRRISMRHTIEQWMILIETGSLFAEIKFLKSLSSLISSLLLPVVADSTVYPQVPVVPKNFLLREEVWKGVVRFCQTVAQAIFSVSWLQLSVEKQIKQSGTPLQFISNLIFTVTSALLYLFTVNLSVWSSLFSSSTPCVWLSRPIANSISSRDVSILQVSPPFVRIAFRFSESQNTSPNMAFIESQYDEFFGCPQASTPSIPKLSQQPLLTPWITSVSVLQSTQQQSLSNSSSSISLMTDKKPAI